MLLELFSKFDMLQPQTLIDLLGFYLIDLHEIVYYCEVERKLYRVYELVLIKCEKM